MAMQMQELEAGKKGETIFHSDLRYFNVAYPPNSEVAAMLSLHEDRTTRF